MLNSFQTSRRTETRKIRGTHGEDRATDIASELTGVS